MQRYRTRAPFLKLPMRFEPAALLRDLGRCLDFGPTRHYNTSDYEGDWTTINLRSPGGHVSTTVFSGAADFADTPALAACPYFRQAIDSLECDKELVRIMSLGPGGRIKPHTDNALGYEDGTFRLHIPITTSTQVDFIVDDQRLDMQPGECWYADFNLTHWVRNRGDGARSHLVVDCTRNRWSDELFGALGYDFEQEATAPPLSPEVRRRVIEELELQDSPAARELIEKLRNEL